MDINDLEKDFSEQKDYVDAQFKTIVVLQKKISKLEEENSSLKVMLEGNLPSIAFATEDLVAGISNEQLICETQILILKERAINGELTLEEARKFELYTNVLKDIKKSGNPIDKYNVSKVSDADLLKIVESNVTN
jgi:polyhydroxyalkanoate synthesis regulator phasin